MKDYYYILGIKRNSTISEIKAAYRKLSKKFHPDVNSGDKFFEERFKEIQEAHEILSNETKRSIYDYELNNYNPNNDIKTETSKNETYSEPIVKESNDGGSKFKNLKWILLLIILLIFRQLVKNDYVPYEYLRVLLEILAILFVAAMLSSLVVFILRYNTLKDKPFQKQWLKHLPYYVAILGLIRILTLYQSDNKKSIEDATVIDSIATTVTEPLIGLNKEALKYTYDYLGLSAKNITMEEFERDLLDNRLQVAVYDRLNIKENGVTYAEFREVLGVDKFDDVSHIADLTLYFPEEVILLESMSSIRFEEETFDWGKVTDGDRVTHVFKFKNTGSEPLIISNAKGSCECVAAEWPKDAIGPGKSGEIKVVFNSDGKGKEYGNEISRPVRFFYFITITSNSDPADTYLKINGLINPNL